MNVSIPDCFMIAFFVGLVFGLVYEVLRIIRLILRFRAAVFVCDIVFFVLAAFAVVKLSTVLGNFVRMYTIFGFGAGVFTYIVTIGRLLNLIESAASVAWRLTIGRLLKKIGGFMRKTFVGIVQKVKLGFVRVSKYFSEQPEKHARHLKLTGKKVYNEKRLDKIGEGENNVIKANVRRGLQ